MRWCGLGLCCVNDKGWVLESEVQVEGGLAVPFDGDLAADRRGLLIQLLASAPKRAGAVQIEAHLQGHAVCV